MTSIYWANNDVSDPVADRAGCLATLRVTSAELEALLSVVPAGSLDVVTDDAAAVDVVRRFLRQAVAYDVRDKVEVPRFMALKSELTSSEVRAVAFARLVVLRDVDRR